MFDLDGLGRFTYVAMEAAIIGGALLFVVAFHIPILWRHWRALALTTALAVIYGSALDAWSIRSGWGWFSPALTSGVLFWLALMIVYVGAAWESAAWPRRLIAVLRGGRCLSRSCSHRGCG